MDNSPIWYYRARAELGEKEIKGGKHNPKILGWWKAISAPFADDETPWCAGFVGAMLEAVGIESTNAANARSYLKWGVKLEKPATGCIVVLWRGRKDGAQGHVGFLEGIDRNGNFMILGGNQEDQVCVRAFPRDRVLGFFWPKGRALPEFTSLRYVSANQSKTEA